MQDRFGVTGKRRGMDRPISRVDLVVANQGGRIGRWLAAIGIFVICCYVAYRIGSG